MNLKMIRYTLGWILLFEAGFLLVPTITAIIYGDSALLAFAISTAICLVAGLLIRWKRPKITSLYSRDGFVIVSLSWIFLSIFGALPLYISGAIPSYIDALFETVSGFTTTGASIITVVEDMENSILMWRSFTHWIGGMGVLVFIMAFLPLGGAHNMHIMKAESPGPDVSKLVPRVRTTAMILYVIYFFMTLLQFILLICGNVSVFDALNIAFSTAGTGGFGFKNDSMGSLSPYIQVVVCVFMLLFSINFNSYYLILKKKLRDAINLEVRTFVFIVLAAITIITINIYPMFNNVSEALRHSSFTVASVISTTGFMTVDFDLWPELSRTIIVIIMFIGACAGSTGGGFKVSRLIILIKGMVRELGQAIHPKQVKKISIDSRPVEHEVVRSVNAYIVCYIILFVSSVALISFDNHDLVTNFTAVAATFNNVGPGLNLVGPTKNFAFFSPLSKIVLIFDMLAGRLELFPMLLLFSPATWKKQ